MNELINEASVENLRMAAESLCSQNENLFGMLSPYFSESLLEKLKEDFNRQIRDLLIGANGAE